MLAAKSIYVDFQTLIVCFQTTNKLLLRTFALINSCYLKISP